MTDLERIDLGRALPATEASADWNDVLARAGTLATRRRPRVLVLCVVALIVAMGAASALGIRALVMETSSVSLPPAGATPSAPERGTLVLRFAGRVQAARGSEGGPVHQVWVYADGRVISRREGGPFGADGVSTGLLERRLTREGLALLRNRVLSSGLFDRSRSLGTAHALWWGTIHVRRGARMVVLDLCCAAGGGFPPSYVIQEPLASPAQARTIARLTRLLTDPTAALPVSAWDDPRPRAYVPSRYALCFSGGSTYSESIHPNRIIPLLPASAAGLLRGTARAYRASPGEGTARVVVCSEVATRDARALDAILRRGAFEPDVSTGGTYALRAEKVNRRLWQIAFEPILPSGGWEAMGG